MLCNAHSFPVVTNWAFWVLLADSYWSSSPFFPLLLWRFSSFQQAGTDGHILTTLLTTLALLSKEGSPGDRKYLARGKALWAASTNTAVCPFCAFWGGKFHLKVLWLGYTQVSLPYGPCNLCEFWAHSGMIFFQLCCSSIHHSDSFCSLICWEVKVSDPLCPAWLISQSTSSEATHEKGEGLEPDSSIRFFLLTLFLWESKVTSTHPVSFPASKKVTYNTYASGFFWHACGSHDLLWQSSRKCW